MRAQLKAKDKTIQQEQEKNKALGEKLAAQDKKFKNQEARVQKKNKEARELSDKIESNNFELEAHRELIEKLRAEKRDIQQKTQAKAQEKMEEMKANIDLLTEEVKFLKKVLDENGIEIQEVEDMEQ